ncbi:ROK family protein [Mycolicibacterium brumae]|uniref:ROK family protein n=1 Tax=Mycolicibacterium brumae TaxID=85968 RepID=A0A2G5PGZ7_9MYCO|nr:ROK family protein [Mycolicibacterium brumae]MCV7192393.1 ROK family protein [Mycolicibacterium brumae]PIB77582.1 ROK family protein [Mycolicibacterium brumae]RWA18617.1 hypothetical protein MBRU_05210 [Mycolicibacterium brumae DSM 44177]UWW10162.1 ROK family protein [Mycolicibacterium brumae]
MTGPLLAIDVGGTKIAVGLVDSGGTLLTAAKHPTPRGEGPEAVWATLAELIAEQTAGIAVRGVGIASAGPVDLPSGTVSPINLTDWRRFPIRDRVAELLPGLPVRLAGDGAAMALGEHWRGAGQGASYVLGMVVSTGVGGGLVLDGLPYGGRTGNAGHVGHVVVEPEGRPCSCGGHGCVETVAAGPHLVEWAREQGWTGPDDARDLAAAADAGDPIALAAFDRAGVALAAMVASVAAVCDLDRVVVGGGVAKAGELLFGPLNRALGRFAGLDFIARLQAVPAELGGDAGLIGAAALAR